MLLSAIYSTHACENDYILLQSTFFAVSFLFFNLSSFETMNLLP